MAYPSTFGSLQQEVASELRLETGDLPKVGDWINRAYARGCLDTEALQQANTAPMTPGVSTYRLPSPIARVKEITVAPAATPTAFGPPLEPIALQTITKLQAGDLLASNPTGGPVQRYCVVGEDEVIFWPTPTAADIALFWWVRPPTPLVSAGDVLEIQEPYGTEICKYGACAEGRPIVNAQVDFDYRSLYQQAIRDYRVHLSRRRALGTQQFVIPSDRPIPSSSSADRGSW